MVKASHPWISGDHPRHQRDTFIAGIAIARRAQLATRNTRHFADLSLAVIDPWGAAG